MVEIEIRISTNASEVEREMYDVEQESIYEFTSIGFSENAYEGVVTFYCPPRAVEPGIIEIIVDLKELAETIIAWSTIFGAIVKFCKRNKKYEYFLTIKRKKGKEEIEIDIPLTENEKSEEIIKEVKEWLKK